MTKPDEVRAESNTYLSIVQVAKRWGVSTTFVRRAIWARQLRARRFGRVIRVAQADVDQFVAKLPQA